MHATLSNLGPIWLLGCGNMAGAMLRRWLDAGLPAETVTVIRPSGVAPAEGVRTLREFPKGEAPPRILLLGVKPQKLAEVADAVASVVGPETLLISILAGTELATLAARFPQAGAVVRAMPNTPVALGRGVVSLYGDAGPRRAELEMLMRTLGLAEWAATEEQFGQMTALAASATRSRRRAPRSACPRTRRCGWRSRRWTVRPGSRPAPTKAPASWPIAWRVRAA